MPIGFRIHPVTQRIPAELVRRFADLPVANVSDAMGRMVAGGASLRPMHAGGVLAGPAVTVKARPGDNLMLHKALDLAEPGDVVVVDAGGDLTNALIGELMTAYAETRGIAGIVIYGAIRDAKTIRENAFPVFAAGITHRGPYKDGPGEVNVPIAIEGMVIRPGDLLLGDDDGLVCVRLEEAETVFATASAKHAAETAQMEKIRRGENPRAWVDETLKRLGCEGL
ncbi:RraA family protein [Sphingomonas sp. Mn802worker]|uniref:RraA family protein n=1 Tax=Sphingomonas sp. Mn802worker TaxID=629773 RepID=UPI00035FD261|nr:RraA family protein [Sphingomonas sp. Mn802worker]